MEMVDHAISIRRVNGGWIVGERDNTHVFTDQRLMMQYVHGWALWTVTGKPNVVAGPDPTPGVRTPMAQDGTPLVRRPNIGGGLKTQLRTSQEANMKPAEPDPLASRDPLPGETIAEWQKRRERLAQGIDPYWRG